MKNNQGPYALIIVLIIAFLISRSEFDPKPVVSSPDLGLKKAQIVHEIGLEEVKEVITTNTTSITFPPVIKLSEVKLEPIIEEIGGICYEIDDEGIMTPCD